MGGGGRMVIERVAFYKILSPKGELIIEVGGGGGAGGYREGTDK